MTKKQTYRCETLQLNAGQEPAPGTPAEHIEGVQDDFAEAPETTRSGRP